MYPYLSWLSCIRYKDKGVICTSVAGTLISKSCASKYLVPCAFFCLYPFTPLPLYPKGVILSSISEGEGVILAWLSFAFRRRRSPLYPYTPKGYGVIAEGEGVRHRKPTFGSGKKG